MRDEHSEEGNQLPRGEGLNAKGSALRNKHICIEDTGSTSLKGGGTHSMAPEARDACSPRGA